MRDLFIEVWESIRRNKIRTCLTGFAVVWGIFMLIVLLGGGNGLMNAFMGDSSELSVNTMEVYGNVTAIPYAGYKQGRSIWLDEKDVRTTEDEAFKDVITGIAAQVSINQNINNGKYFNNVNVVGTSPEAKITYNVKMLYGRFLNEKDIKSKNKVTVIPSIVAENISKKPEDAPKLLGKMVKIGGVYFKVVGIYKTNSSLQTGNAFCPYPTVKALWSNDKYVDWISFTFDNLKTKEENEAFEARYKAALNANHSAAPNDNSAIWISNGFTQADQLNQAKSMLTTGLWIIGLLTLLSGIVGIGNIMLITVKERTHEFGIRKALGAKPWGITKLIITESVMITAFFGYIGMVLGMLACEILDKLFGQNPITVLGQTEQVFKNPGVGLDVAIEATIVLIIAGTIAGLIPALKAAKVKPIEALRAD